MERVVSVDSAREQLDVDRRIEDDVHLQFLYQIDQEIQAFFIMHSLANDNLVDIGILQQLSDLIAADSLDDRLFADDVVYVLVTDHHHLLPDPLAGLHDKLIDLEDQKEIHEKGDRKDARRKRAPPGPESVD